jgi:lactoylglutathione lyase
MEQAATSDSSAGSWAKRFFAVVVFVRDLAESRKFYLDCFEQPIVDETETNCTFRFPGNVFINLVEDHAAAELIEPAPVGPPGTPARLMLTLEVDDIDAVCDRLRAKGVTFLNGPIDRPWGRRAVFADPDGNCWELAV